MIRVFATGATGCIDQGWVKHLLGSGASRVRARQTRERPPASGKAQAWPWGIAVFSAAQIRRKCAAECRLQQKGVGFQAALTPSVPAV